MAQTSGIAPRLYDNYKATPKGGKKPKGKK